MRDSLEAIAHLLDSTVVFVDVKTESYNVALAELEPCVLWLVYQLTGAKVIPRRCPMSSVLGDGCSTGHEAWHVAEIYNPRMKIAYDYKIVLHAVRHLISHHLPGRLLSCVILFPYFTPPPSAHGSEPIFCQAHCLFAFQPCQVPPSHLSSAPTHQGTCLLAGGGGCREELFHITSDLAPRPAHCEHMIAFPGWHWAPLHSHHHLLTG